MLLRSINENDVILIYVENKPTFFARVEKITADIKPNWWRVKLLVLQMPLITTTWILDNDQIRGEEFTMNGIPIRIELVKAPEEKSSDFNQQQNDEHENRKNSSARILSLNRKADSKSN